MLSPKFFRVAHILSAIILLFVGGRHVVLAIAHEGNVTRHWVFVVINIAFASMLLLRPRWAFYPTIVLGGQQMWSHGLDLSRSFLGTAPLEWSSLAVCLFFPTLLTILFMERQEEREKKEIEEHEVRSVRSSSSKREL